MDPLRVSFVCTGNICRSPIGEVVLRAQVEAAGLVSRVLVESAGTGGWHRGEGADPRAVAVLAAHGYDGSRHRARKFDRSDFARLDLVLALDRSHLHALHALARSDADRAKVRLLRSFDPEAVPVGDGLEVADPYYEDEAAFRGVLTQVEAACVGVVDELRARLRG